MPPRPRKRFAQHWLRHEASLNRIVAAAQLQPSDRLLEIGPGLGVLTRRLLPLAQTVVAVEIDRDLCQHLRQEFRQADRLQLIEGDILAPDIWQQVMESSTDPSGTDLSGTDLSGTNPSASAPLSDPSVTDPSPSDPLTPPPNKVVANIPYNITGPILERLLGTIARPNSHPFDAIVLLLQKEVADRLCAAPGSKVFGALTVRVQYLATCEWVALVPASAFQPPPQVESAIVRLVPRPYAPLATDPAWLDRLVKLGFATRRKLLRNNLQSVIDRQVLTDWLQSQQLNPQSRAEELGLDHWIALSEFVSQWHRSQQNLERDR